MTRAALRALLREAALAYGPFGQYDGTLPNRLWTAYDRLGDADIGPADCKVDKAPIDTSGSVS